MVSALQASLFKVGHPVVFQIDNYVKTVNASNLIASTVIIIIIIIII